MKAGDKIKRVRDAREYCPLGFVTEALLVDGHMVHYRHANGKEGIALKDLFEVVNDDGPVTVETREVYTINNGTYGRLCIKRTDNAPDQVGVAFTNSEGQKVGYWFLLTADELDEAAANLSALAKALRHV